MDAAAEEKFLDQLLEDLENDKLVLPTLPEVALKVRDTLEDENSSLIDVAKIITSDAALSAVNIISSTSLRMGSFSDRPICASSALPMMAVSKLLKSWATPPASLPTASIF